MFDADENRMIGLPYGEKKTMTLSRFYLIPERYGQTDRFAISISRVCMLTRDKNSDSMHRFRTEAARKRGRILETLKQMV